jgi:hypothetical protein
MNEIHIELTPEQLEKLQPFFAQNTMMAAMDKPGMIIGQIFKDGMRVGLLTHEHAWRLSNRRMVGSSKIEKSGGEL